MTKRIVLVHAVTVAIQPVIDAFQRLWPAAERVNVLDDSLPRDRGKSDDLTPALFRRFQALSSYAELIGADGLLFTCSAFGPAIAAAAKTVSFPVLKPNEAMFEAALDLGRHIGMVATFAPAVATMEHEFDELAARRNTGAQVTTICVPEAMAALNKGEAGRHNLLVAEAARDLADCDAVMLAHFSTSGAQDDVERAVRVPVLTSPGSAVRKLKALLDA
jgi:Asp/Glu/hydantoin racemase